jgi:hypothetical protein
MWQWLTDPGVVALIGVIVGWGLAELYGEWQWRRMRKR